MLNIGEFKVEYLTEGTYTFVLAILDIVDISIFSTPLITISSEFFDLAEMFLEEITNILPKHGPQELALETLGAPLFMPLYNLS